MANSDWFNRPSTPGTSSAAGGVEPRSQPRDGAYLATSHDKCRAEIDTLIRERDQMTAMQYELVRKATATVNERAEKAERERDEYKNGFELRGIRLDAANERADRIAKAAMEYMEAKDKWAVPFDDEDAAKVDVARQALIDAMGEK